MDLANKEQSAKQEWTKENSAEEKKQEEILFALLFSERIVMFARLCGVL